MCGVSKTTHDKEPKHNENVEEPNKKPQANFSRYHM